MFIWQFRTIWTALGYLRFAKNGDNFLGRGKYAGKLGSLLARISQSLGKRGVYMFENGLQYVRADFHLHTRKDKEFKYSGESNSFIKEYISALKDADIKIGVITNHNKFDSDEFSAIRKAANKQNIFVLPGVELSVKEGANGVHTLIVFNPNEWLEHNNNHIQTFLTSAFATIDNPDNSNSKCLWDLRQTLKKLEEYGRDYFIIFAHVDNKSGLFHECEGGLLKSLSGLAPFRKRVLGLQKSKCHANREKFQQYFGYVPALVQGSDPKCIADVGKGDITYLKLGEFSYSAVKFALQDYKNRVSVSIPKLRHGYIESISFQGGKFTGQTITFSNQLNTLIGIRGSGKSSVLEAVRYGLGLEGQTDRDYKESLIKNVLGSGGKVSLKIVDKYSKGYVVSRILGETPKICNEYGENLNISTFGLLDGIQYFGQKDLASSADNQNGLIEKIVSCKITKSEKLDRCVDSLIDVAKHLLEVRKIPSQIQETTIKHAELKHKLSIFREKGIADKLKKQGGYTTDATKVEAVIHRVNQILVDIKAAVPQGDTLLDFSNMQFSDFNRDVFDQILKILGSIQTSLNQIGVSLKEIEKERNKLEDSLFLLNKRISEMADEFAEIKREINDETLDVDSFVRLTKDLEKSQEELKQLNSKLMAKRKLESAFSKAVRDRNDALLSTYEAYKSEIEGLNKNQNQLRIEIEFKGEKEKFKSQMKSDFKGTGITDNKYQEICTKFSDYVSIVEDWLINDGNKLKAIVSASEYAKLEEKFRIQYEDLLRYQVRNKVEIYYHDKLLRKHSLGQRASALVLFLLKQDNNDIIIIDQPEDDLDNKVIYEEVIKAIVDKKSGMQFIFATHNANIPVLGDAERVLVTEYAEDKIDVNQGNIDLAKTHEQIVNIMEGGKEAFDKRQLIYTSWY